MHIERNEVNAQTRKNLNWLWLALAVLVLDYLTKAWFSANMQLGESIDLLPFFSWTLAHNYGAAFSFLHDAGGWQRWFFGAIAIVVSVGLTWWLVRLKDNERFLACALALVLGGAIGNLYDRMVLGYVVDFIHVHYGTWHFPAFNIADCGISVGAFMLVIDSLFFEKKRQAVHV
ncbi:MAG: lipoprotein signal peptidase [Moraxellaceae bacterium]|nr:lipoprotein signal peptidase [Moraxellaceae bacterium]